MSEDPQTSRANGPARKRRAAGPALLVVPPSDARIPWIPRRIIRSTKLREVRRIGGKQTVPERIAIGGGGYIHAAAKRQLKLTRVVLFQLGC